MNKNENNKQARMIGVFMMIPFVLAVPPIVGWYMGSWLDQFFGTKYILMFIFIILGIIAGVKEFISLLKKYGKGENL